MSATVFINSSKIYQKHIIKQKKLLSSIMACRCIFHLHNSTGNAFVIKKERIIYVYLNVTHVWIYSFEFTFITKFFETMLFETIKNRFKPHILICLKKEIEFHMILAHETIILSKHILNARNSCDNNAFFHV